MKRLKNWDALIPLVLVAVLWTFRDRPPLPKETTPFSVSAIYAELPPHPEWDTPPLQGKEGEEVRDALAQPYHYLGSGGQCYTFVSLDDKYVIKFMKQKVFALPAWVQHLPTAFGSGWIKRKKLLKKEAQRGRVCAAFKLAFEQRSCETGLLFVHLNPAQNLHSHTLLSVSAGGEIHHLDLDAVQFVLQKKATLAPCYIDTLVQTGDLQGAQCAIDALLTLIVTLQNQGLRNRDPNFCANFGFIEGRAALIDVGRLVRSEAITLPVNYTKELLRTTSRFKKYLAENHPQLLEYFEKEVVKMLISYHE